MVEKVLFKFLNVLSLAAQIMESADQTKNEKQGFASSFDLLNFFCYDESHNLFDDV